MRRNSLRQAVTAEETSAAQEAEREHLHDTKSFSANQLGRIFTGWSGWLDTLRANKMLEADEERRDEERRDEGVPAQFNTHRCAAGHRGRSAELRRDRPLTLTR